MEQNNALESDREELMLAAKYFWCKFAFFNLLLKAAYRTLSYIKVLLDQNEIIVKDCDVRSKHIKELEERLEAAEASIFTLESRLEQPSKMPNQQAQNLMRRPSDIIQGIKDAEYIKEHGDREGDTN